MSAGCERGFSLIEVLVASLIMLIVTTALFTSLEQTQLFYEDFSGDMDLRQSARVVIGQIAGEIRMIGYGTGDLEETISLADATGFQFTGDVDDGDEAGACGAAAEAAVGGGAERITYTYDAEAATLVRVTDCWDGSTWTVAAQTVTLLTRLPADGVRFRYYDADGVELPTDGGPLTESERAAVTSVAVTVSLEDSDAEELLGDDRVDLTLAQHVRLRNLED